jgi:PilZ domain
MSSQAAKRGGGEKRRMRRHPLRYAAWVAVGDDTPAKGCTVADVSETGARLELESPGDLPKEFWLLLSRDGKVRRRCEVVWQTGDQVGARYLVSALAGE